MRGGRVVAAGSRCPIAGVPVRLVRAAPADLPADTATVADGVTAADGAFLLMTPGTGAYRVWISDEYLAPLWHSPRRPTPGKERWDAVVEAVVGPDGRTDPESVRVVSATSREFGAAAERYVQTARFTPAEVDGRKTAGRA